MRIVQQTRPASEPVLLSELKENLRIDEASEDSKLDALIVAARSVVEANLNLNLISRPIDIYYDRWPVDNGFASIRPVHSCISELRMSPHSGSQNTFDLPIRPVESITGITITDSQGIESAWDPSNYFLQPGLVPNLSLAAGSSWPAPQQPKDSFKVSVISGFGASWNSVPDDIRQALLQIATQLYFNRGDTAVSSGGLLSASDVRDLLAPYRLVRI